MTDKKMRCHFTIILENCWKTLLVLLLLIVPDIDAEMAQDVKRGGVVLPVIFLALIAVILIFQLFRWKKTTVMLEEDALIWERATLNKKTLTINVQNISSINLEQNLFERIIHTSRVKIDTNSLSTASKTDINLLFQKETAEKFKAYIEARMRLVQNGGTSVEMSETGEKRSESGDKMAVQYASSLSDIAMHSLYDISLISILLTVGVLLGFLGSFYELLESAETSDLVSLFGTALVGVFIVFSFLASIFKRFFTYYNFTVGRKRKRIFLSYGLLKKREYTLPVEMINALLIKQTLIGRIFRRYSAAIECIGVGDEENETAQLTISLPYEEMLNRIRELLPEYELDALEQCRPVPKKGIFHKLSGNLYLILFFLAAWLGISLVPGVDGVQGVEAVLLGVFAFCVLWNLIRIFLSMRTESLGMGKNYVALTTGSFGRKTVMLQYHKIQHLEYRSSPVTRWTGLHTGNVHILSKASVLNSPMLSGNELEQLKQKCLEL